MKKLCLLSALFSFSFPCLAESIKIDLSLQTIEDSLSYAHSDFGTVSEIKINWARKNAGNRAYQLTLEYKLVDENRNNVYRCHSDLYPMLPADGLNEDTELRKVSIATCLQERN